MKIEKMLMVTLIAAVSFALLARAESQQPEQDTKLPQPKSAITALTLSLGGTVLPVTTAILTANDDGPDDSQAALIYGGIFVGPSLGYFYVGDSNRAFRGILIRTVVFGGSVYIGSQLGLDIFGENDDGWPVAITGMAIVLGDALYDIAAVPGCAKKHNKLLREKARSSLSVLPTYFADSRAPGLQFSVEF